MGIILTTETIDELEEMYLQHVLDEAGIAVQAARRATMDMHSLLQSCPNLVHASVDSFLHQQECAWMQTSGYALHRDQSDYNPGYDESEVGISTGIQREPADDLFVELAGAFDLYRLDSDNFDQQGYRLHAGGAVKKEFGNVTFSAALSGGVFGYDYTRIYDKGDDVHAASSNPFGGFIGGELRASAVFNRDRFYAKPALALSAVQIWQQSFVERGAGGFEWEIDGVSESYFAIRPSIEVGRSFTINAHPATVYLRTGLVAFLNDPDTSMSGQFAGFDDALPDFDVLLESDRYFGELALGMDAQIGQSMTLSLIGQGLLSENSWAAGGSIRLRHQF
jgi:hypothetical protein